MGNISDRVNEPQIKLTDKPTIYDYRSTGKAGNLFLNFVATERGDKVENINEKEMKNVDLLLDKMLKILGNIALFKQKVKKADNLRIYVYEGVGEFCIDKNVLTCDERGPLEKVNLAEIVKDISSYYNLLDAAIKKYNTEKKKQDEVYDFRNGELLKNVVATRNARKVENINEREKGKLDLLESKIQEMVESIHLLKQKVREVDRLRIYVYRNPGFQDVLDFEETDSKLNEWMEFAKNIGVYIKLLNDAIEMLRKENM